MPIGAEGSLPWLPAPGNRQTLVLSGSSRLLLERSRGLSPFVARAENYDDQSLVLSHSF